MNSANSTPATNTHAQAQTIRAAWEARGNGHDYACFATKVRFAGDGSIYLGPCSCANTCLKCARNAKQLKLAGLLRQGTEDKQSELEQIMRLFGRR